MAVAQALEGCSIVLENVIEERELFAVGVLRIVEDDEWKALPQPVGQP